MSNLALNMLHGKSILLSGGTGFIGKNFLQYLCFNKVKLARLTIITRNVAKFKSGNPEFISMSYLDFIESDICNLEYNGSDYDYVIHGATAVVDKVDHLKLMDEIIFGTKSILNFAVKAKAKSVINISSGAVYGVLDNKIKVTESFANNLRIENVPSSYGIAKQTAEHIAYLYSVKYNLKITTLRCFAFAGSYLDSQHYALGDFITKVLKNEDIIVKAGKNIYRSYMAADELAEWMAFLLHNGEGRVSNYEVYNAGSEEAISIPDLALRVRDVLGSKIAVNSINLSDCTTNYYVPNINKLKELGITVKFSLNDVISQTANYYIRTNKY